MRCLHDERVFEHSDLPRRDSSEKVALQMETEVQKSTEARAEKTPEVNSPLEKTPERRYPARIRRPPNRHELE